MPTWLIIILVVAAICGIIGFFSSEEGERSSGAAEGAMAGAMAGAMGCGYLLFRLFLWGLGIAFLIWLFGAIFG